MVKRTIAKLIAGPNCAMMPRAYINGMSSAPTPLRLRAAYVGFGLIFLAGLVLWAGFGTYIFADFVSFARSCF